MIPLPAHVEATLALAAMLDDLAAELARRARVPDPELPAWRSPAAARAVIERGMLLHGVQRTIASYDEAARSLRAHASRVADDRGTPQG